MSGGAWAGKPDIDLTKFSSVMAYSGLFDISYAGACCSAGLDFVLKGEHSYPQDYPKVGQVITVSGKFGMYHEGQEVFFRLEDAEIL